MNDPIKASLSILPHEKLVEILLALDDLEDIFNACRSSTIFARVCQDDYFWELRYQQDFGSGRPSEEMLKRKMPWREFYKLIIESRYSPPLSAGKGHLGVIDQNGRLNMWGRNDSGQLGNGTQISTKVSQVVLSNVLQVSCSDTKTGAVTTDGKVYVWGNKFEKMLGTSLYNDYILVPRLVRLPKKVRKIDHTDMSSIVLTEDGEVYAWGQLTINLYIGSPIKLNLPSNDNKAIDVATGARTFAAITTSGKLYMWGDANFYLYLSKNWKSRPYGNYNPDNPDHKTLIQPTLIPFSGTIRQISMGGTYFGVVTEKGKLWMAGTNNLHQIGEYTPNKKELDTFATLGGSLQIIRLTILTLIPIKFSSSVLYFDARWDTSLVKLRDGRILMWGNNYRGQIDPVKYYTPKERNEILWGIVIKTPAEIRLDRSIIYISVGGVFTAAITDDNYVNIWGTDYSPE